MDVEGKVYFNIDRVEDTLICGLWDIDFIRSCI
jgi:hypothetical protein